MRRLARESGYYLLIGLVTSLLAIPAMGLLHAHLSIPFDYSSDALSGATHIKNVLEHGWIDYYPAVGAPEGRHGNDFPGADNLHLFVVAALGLVVAKWPIVLNTYFLLGFPLAAMTAAWFFRVVGVSRATGAMAAVLFAYTPYHFIRGEIHLYLAAYYVVPLGAVLIYRVIIGEPLWLLGTGRLRVLTARNAGTVVVCLLLATASSYYSMFALLFLTFAGLVAFAHNRNWRRLGGILAVQALLVVTMLANMLPNLLYENRHGANLTALDRSPKLTEFHQLKLTQLLLPTPHHRLHALDQLRYSYDRTFGLPAEYPALGVVASIGLVFLLGVTLVGAVNRGSLGTALPKGVRSLASLTLFGVLVGTVGGLSTLFALFVTDAFRGWSRIVIYLALFSLAGVAGLVDRVVARSWVGVRTPVTWALVLVVGVVGLLDEVPGDFPFSRAEVVASWQSDDGFVHHLEAGLPAQAMVLQLPYVPFPEAHVVDASDSDPLRMYLHSTQLRWSNGGIRGRPAADWAAEVGQFSPDRVASLGANAGFDGVVVDRNGYSDAGVGMRTQLTAFLGETAYTSDDGRFAFFDLRGLRERLAASHPAAELERLRVHTLLHPVGYASDLQTANPSAAFDNPLGEPQEVLVKLDIVTKDRPDGVLVTWPDGARERVSLRSGRAVVERTLSLRAGRSWAHITTLTPGVDVVGHPVDMDLVRYRLSALVPDRVLEEFRP